MMPHNNPASSIQSIAQTSRLLLAGLISLTALSAQVHAADVTWDNVGTDDKFSTANNWDTNVVPTGGDNALMTIGGTVTYDDGQTNSMDRAIIEGGTVFNMSGGTFNASLSGNTVRFVVGKNGTGTVNQSEGTMGIGHLIAIGWGDIGDYNLSGGVLNISRAGSTLQGSSANPSISLGPSNGTGTLNISGGTLTTRAGVEMGSNALFKVSGGRATEIGIGSHDSGDGYWNQLSGATLSVGIDFGGLTKIFIDDVEGTNGNFATFESGSLLDVDYFNGFVGGGTWTVLELENGDITDNGLAFAAGVDTNIWSFAIDNSGTNGLLTITSSDSAAINDAYWDGSENTTWEEPLNWTNNYGAFQASYVHIDSGTVDYTATSDAGINLRGFRMTAGTLNISGGNLVASQLASAYSQMDGTVNQTGGSFDVNALELGRGTSSSAIYNMSDGELKIARAANDFSLYLGANSSGSNSGSGTLTITGGKLTSRTGVKLGHASNSGTGNFEVLGTGASEIGIGSQGSIDGTWEQHAGSTLKVGIDYAGVTKIFIDDVADGNGTSATFESGALLDVDYYNAGSGGGTWVVLEVENADITDNGLAFAAGVDTNVWSFGIDNSGPNGILYVTATGAFAGESITIGNTEQQKMRYGMDYERLWYWTGSLNSSERDDIARWSAVDTDIDFIRVAMNSGYELTEGTFVLSAYTNKIIPLMQEMQQANPNLKFFASPRPLDEAVSGASWQPYPLWVTDPGETSYTNTSYDFAPIKCAEYMVKYLLLMKSYGFKISFLDVTNEWQNSSGGRVTADDMDDIHNYLHVTYMAAPWEHPDYPGITLTPADIPELVGPSSHNYFEGTSWIHSMDSGDAAALSIAASHNTGRNGSAEAFVERVRARMGTDAEIWNTEQHGWKSTSGENETTSFFYYLESIRAGFGGINGWLAIGTTSQGHAYILNPNGTPTRNVKYHIYQKLSSTSNYGHALDILDEPAEGVLADLSNEYDSERNVAAFIKGNLMTVWVINENATSVPLTIAPTGYTIATSTIRKTRWTDPSDVEGFESLIPITSNTSFTTIIPGESVVCFEIVLNTETFANQSYEAEDYSHQWGTGLEDQGSYVNVANISDGDWLRFGSVALEQNSILSFSVARPSGRPDGFIRVREGNAEEGTILGEIEVPETGNWQSYQTIYSQLDVQAGIYNLYIEFIEDAVSPTGAAFVNIDSFTVNDPAAPAAPTNLTATANGTTQIDLAWNAVSGATSYSVLRATSAGGNYTEIASGLTTTSSSDATASPGVPYFYVVRALNGTVESADSNEATATLPLLAPTGLTATANGSTQIDLAWNAVSGATSYTVLRATSAGGTYAEFASGLTTTSTSDATASIGVPYYYVVKAVNGAVESEDSNEATATLPLLAPTNLTATENGTTQIDLNWNAVSEATSYSVLRGTTSGGAYTEIANSLTTTSTSDTTASPGLTYYYVVRAINGAIESANSNEADATLPLDAPTGLTATPISSSQIDLSWNSVNGATGYTVMRAPGPRGPYGSIASGIVLPSYSDTTGLTAGNRFYYRVFASTSEVDSSDSAIVSAVPSDPIVVENIVFGPLTVDLSNNSFDFSIQNSVLGHNYQAQHRQNLTIGDWVDVGGLKLGNGGILDFSIPILETDEENFFRVNISQQ